MRKRIVTVACVLASLAPAAPAGAHGGGLDQNGGHHSRPAQQLPLPQGVLPAAIAVFSPKIAAADPGVVELTEADFPG